MLLSCKVNAFCALSVFELCQQNKLTASIRKKFNAQISVCFTGFLRRYWDEFMCKCLAPFTLQMEPMMVEVALVGTVQNGQPCTFGFTENCHIIVNSSVQTARFWRIFLLDLYLKQDSKSCPRKALPNHHF